MSWFFAVCALLLAATVLTVLVKESGGAVYAPILTLAVAVLIFGQVIPRLSEIFAVFVDFGEQAGVNRQYLLVIMKIMVISYLTEFLAALCRDAGESAYAAKLELVGKLSVITLAIPVVVNMLSAVLSILPD